jgi:ribosomal protein S18 acetylase RimI-like enzyme
MNSEIAIVQADLQTPEHQEAIVSLIANYAEDAMGNGKSLPDDVLSRLVPEISKIPTAMIFLAYTQDKAVGIAICFLGFSSFAAKPLLNIHDLAVMPEYRNLGIGKMLLNAVESKAKELNCCKVTLEVLENNDRAKNIYHKAGYSQVKGGNDNADLLFYSKYLHLI